MVAGDGRRHGALAAAGPPAGGRGHGQRIGRLPYSRSSFDRVGHAVGQLYTPKKIAIDDALIVALAIPPGARSVSVGLDRVSLPLEEPRPRPVGRPRKGAPTRPVPRVFRMAYCATITFHDEDGTALQTIRQGAVPSVEPHALCDRLLADTVAILEQRPDLPVVLLTAGAPELRDLLRHTLAEATLGTRVDELLDFWHLLEKLAPAAEVLSGAARTREALARWRRDLLNRHAAPDPVRHARSPGGADAPCA